MARPRDILLRLTGDPTDAKRALGDVEDKLAKFDRIKAEARAEIATAGAKAQLENLETQLSRLSKQEATPAVQIRTAKTLEQIERIEKKLAGIKDQTVNVKVHEKDVAGAGKSGSSALGLGGLGGLGSKALGGAAVGALAVVGLKSVADAAAQSEVSQAKLRAQLKASNISYAQHAAAIDVVIQKTSKLSGLDDEDLQDAFTNIVRVTGNVAKSMKLVGLAADFARAKNIDVAKAGEIVAKVAGGNVGVLSRYGIQIDKGATSTEALGKLQEKFAGQAKAYGDTAAGAQDKFAVASENLRETLGKSLTPVLVTLANAAVGAVTAIDDGAAGIGDALDRNKRTVNDVKEAFAVFAHVVKGTVVEAIARVREALRGMATTTRGVVRVIRGLLTLDMKEIFGGLGDIAKGGMDLLRATLRSAIAPLRAAGRAIGNGIKSGIRGALKGLEGIGTSAVNALIKAVNAGINAVNAVLGPHSLGSIGGHSLGHTPGIHLGTIDPIGGAGDFGGKRPQDATPGPPRHGTRSAPNVTITVPGGGPPDPKVLARSLSRELARHPG